MPKVTKVKETMTLEGFIPYDSKAAERYEKKRWWLGITLGDMLDKAADLYPRKVALIGSGKRYTYSELRLQADTMAYRLLQAGFKPGDRVLLQLPNWPEFVISYFALQKAGLISYHRGHITVLDRPGLESRTCECYAVVKQEYDRLLPNVIKS